MTTHVCKTFIFNDIGPFQGTLATDMAGDGFFCEVVEKGLPSAQA